MKRFLHKQYKKVKPFFLAIFFLSVVIIFVYKDYIIFVSYFNISFKLSEV